MNYQKIYDQLISKRRSQRLKKIGNGMIETHHVIPKACHGTNDLDNLVNLTLREHYIAHVLLMKIHAVDEYSKSMATAWQSMCRKMKLLNLPYAKINSRLFEALRIQANKSMCGTIWINDGKQNLRIKSNTIPNGFSKGLISSGKIWINDGTIEMYEYENQIPSGFTKGRLKHIITKLTSGDPSCKGTIFINNGIETKRISKTLPIPDGYVKGRIVTDKMRQHNRENGKCKCSVKLKTVLKSLIWITNDIEMCRVNKNSQIPKGWHKGKLKNYIFINNGQLEKTILKSETIPENWNEGRIKRKK